MGGDPARTDGSFPVSLFARPSTHLLPELSRRIEAAKRTVNCKSALGVSSTTVSSLPQPRVNP